MCCRFYVLPQDRELAPVLRAAAKSGLLTRFARADAGTPVLTGEIAPSAVAAVVACDRQRQAAVFPMRWGFSLPGKTSLLVNARVETAAEKPSFRQAWQSHRCVIPASWYFEWQQRPAEDGAKAAKQKYAIRPRDGTTVYLAGLYRIENGLPVFVVLTRPPSPDVAQIHDRMPLILPKQAVRTWIQPDARAEDLLSMAVTALAPEIAK